MSLSFEFPWKKKNNTVEPPNPQERRVSFREQQIKELIHDVAVFLVEEEFLGRERKMSDVPPKDSYKFILETREQKRREETAAKMKGEMDEKIKMLEEDFRAFLNSLESEMVDKFLFPKKEGQESIEDMKERRVDLFLEFYEKHKKEVLKGREIPLPALSLEDQAIHHAAVLLAGSRGDGDIEGAEKDIRSMLSVHKNALEEIRKKKNNTGEDSPENLGKDILDYLRGKKRENIAG